MPCPFPGMDPFIEGQRWAGFHHSFLAELQYALVSYVRPRYEVCLEERVYIETSPSRSLPDVIRPDAIVAEARREYVTDAGGDTPSATPVKVPVVMPEEVREAYLEMRLTETREVVTVIELLSPSNKRAGSDGYREYLAKRQTVLSSSTHLVEIDLLRGGERLPMAKPLPPADYYVIVSRAEQRPWADVRSLSLRQRMPTVQIPLANDDPDIPLDLQTTFTAVYDRAGYDYAIRYELDAVPPLPAADAAWAHELVGHEPVNVPKGAAVCDRPASAAT